MASPTSPRTIMPQARVRKANPSVDCPHLRRTVEHIHALGPRALGELFVEIDADPGVIDNYARLSPDVLTAVGGDRWPSSVFTVST